jgi:mono/diheme cytochrome c family protein
MKKVQNPNSISRRILCGMAFMLALSFNSIAQTPAPVAAAQPTSTMATPAAAGGDAAKGKELFNANCAACHKLDAKMTGPALRGVSGRHSKDWLYTWIKNSSAMIKSGDADALKIFNEYNKSVMTAFPQLSNADIDNIIAYTDEPKPVPVAAPVPKDGSEVQGGSGVSNDLILAGLALVLLILVAMLFLVNRVLAKVAKANGIEVAPKAPTTPIWKAFAKNQFLVLVTTIFLMLASAYFAYGWMMQIGVDQGYEPIQPIIRSYK